jgi:predicted anti-sigma-YlaC factor YlaD
MKDCTWVVERMSAYVDGDLRRREERHVVAHLGACRCCRRATEQMRTVVTALPRLRERRTTSVADRTVAAVRWRLDQDEP